MTKVSQGVPYAANNSTNCTPLTKGCSNVPTAQQMFECELNKFTCALMASGVQFGNNGVKAGGQAVTAGGGMIAGSPLTGLDSYVRRTVLTDSGIVHRTCFGQTITAPYSSLVVVDNEERILITVGRCQIALRKRDGKLQEVSRILKQKVDSYIAVN